MNSVSNSAAPGFDEVLGLGEELEAWYGVSLGETVADLAPGTPLDVRAVAFKRVLALLCAVKAPTHYLVNAPEALDRRVTTFAAKLGESGVIDPAMARAIAASRSRLPDGVRSRRRIGKSRPRPRTPCACARLGIP